EIGGRHCAEFRTGRSCCHGLSYDSGAAISGCGTPASDIRTGDANDWRLAMEQRKLGATGPMTSAFGLGCMGMSGMYGPADGAEGIATIHAALDAGITLLDTGDFYGHGHNEMLIGDAVAGLPRDRYQLSVKYGGLRDPAGNWIGFDASPRGTK